MINQSLAIYILILKRIFWINIFTIHKYQTLLYMPSTDDPLSNIDILKKVNCNFMVYGDVYKIHNITELLPRTLILYQPAQVGHFTCVFKNRDGINYFDPFGFVPDIPLSWGDYDGSSYTYLTKLLTSPEHITYNEFHLQDKDTSTCGHWCAIRLLYSNLTNEEFHDCFRGIQNKDSVIVNVFNSF